MSYGLYVALRTDVFTYQNYFWVPWYLLIGTSS